MLNLATPLDSDDPVLMSDDELWSFTAPISGDLGDSYYRALWQNIRLSDRITAPHLTARLDDEHDAANEPLLSVVEVFVAPDDSYDALDLDPDLYGYGVPATEAETMAAPFDWDAMTEGAAA